jgi:hypothetical protein
MQGIQLLWSFGEDRVIGDALISHFVAAESS